MPCKFDSNRISKLFKPSNVTAATSWSAHQEWSISYQNKPGRGYSGLFRKPVSKPFDVYAQLKRLMQVNGLVARMLWTGTRLVPRVANSWCFWICGQCCNKHSITDLGVTFRTAYKRMSICHEQSLSLARCLVNAFQMLIRMSTEQSFIGKFTAHFTFFILLLRDASIKA